MQLSPEELVRLMGMDDSQWKSAGYLEDLLQMLHQQRKENINSKRGAYIFAERYMYRWTFEQRNGSYYDSKRKSLWYLGQKAPKEPEDPTLDVQHTYHIIQRTHFLCVYINPRGLPSKRIFQFDMLRADHRVAFLSIRRHAADQYPLVDKSVPAKHRDLLRLQHSPRGHRIRRREMLKRSSVLAGKPQNIDEDSAINDG